MAIGKYDLHLAMLMLESFLGDREQLRRLSCQWWGEGKGDDVVLNPLHRLYITQGKVGGI